MKNTKKFEAKEVYGTITLQISSSVIAEKGSDFIKKLEEKISNEVVNRVGEHNLIPVFNDKQGQMVKVHDFNIEWDKEAVFDKEESA